MSTDEPRYQGGICPNCPVETQQRFLFATHDRSGPLHESGKVTGYARIRTLSLFRCEGCSTTLLYETMLDEELEGPFSLDAYDIPNPEWVIEDEFEFLKASKLLYYSPLPYPRQEKSILDPSTPESVRKCYQIGISVREISHDLYALQLRKALEAVCNDLGAAERLSSGKRAMLWQQIDELGKQNLVGEFICKVAHELKDISNNGAHYSEQGVTEVDISKLEQLLGLITTYVYGSKNQ
jgi:hypothetical protein